MRIIRHRRISESPWRHAPDGVSADARSREPSGAVIVTLAAWRRRRSEFLAAREPVGVRLDAGDDLDEIVPYLDSIALIALVFGSFNEGRAYTLARKLRQRHGYRGEIRAVGDVSRDRLVFMERCGFDAYELGCDDRLRDALNAFAEISDVYQACADGRTVIASRRT